MLTVQALLDELGLSLTAGKESAEAPIRWVHITELLDPTPWMSGGELLLTTGMTLTDESEQRAFVHRLVDHHVAGLGLGVGFRHDTIPAAMVDEAGRQGFPLFAVPYEMPFIAITEKAFGRLVNEQYEMLQRGIAVHRRLEQLVLEQRGLGELARALSAAIGGTVVLLDSQGEEMASAIFRREVPAAGLDSIRAEVAERNDSGPATSFEPAQDDIAGRALALPVTAEPNSPRVWIVAIRDSGGLGEFERLILQQAVAVVALELMRSRVVRDTERRLAGDVLEEIVKGELEESELRGRLRPFGIGSESAVLVFGLKEPAEAEAEEALERTLTEAGAQGLVATRDGLLCAIVDGSAGDPLELAARVRTVLGEERGPVRAAASRVAPTGALRRSFHEATYALEAAGMLDGRAPDVASWQDLGALQFLLAVQDDEALRLYTDSVLGPIENGGDYGGELLRSLEAFVEHNGQWERAARELFCHRHTLRYRIRRVEQLTGRDLSSARDRIEFWLALKARELLP